jgi:hypothetical protein
VLAVLECRHSDDAVCERALELVRERGGFVCVVAVVPRAFPWLNAGPYCTPAVTAEERRQQAEAALARAVALIPPEVPVVACLEEGRARDVIRRRVETCQPDVVVRRRRRRGRLVPRARPGNRLPTIGERGPACSKRT